MANHPLSEFPAGPVIPRGDVREIEIVRPRPRIYLHRLAQHVCATPTQRRALVTEQKYPSAFQMSYEPAKRLFSDALAFGWSASELKGNAATRWLSAELPSPSAQHRRLLAVEAVNSFARMLPALSKRLDSLSAEFAHGSDEHSPLFMANVLVNDSPAVRLHRVVGDEREVGLISFHSAKSRSHSIESAQNAAALLTALAAENCDTGSVVRKELVLVVDVFTGNITDANRGNCRRLRQASAACKEIAALWSAL